MERPTLVVGAFDDLRYRGVRLLDEASRLGPVTVLLLTDEAIEATTNRSPKFPWPERLYLLQAVRFVSQVLPLNALDSRQILAATSETRPRLWLDREGTENEARRQLAVQSGLDYRVVPSSQLAGFPESLVSAAHSKRKKVIVTGCYDWLHSGHVRFFEEVSAYGDLYVVVGHDANIRLLKGEGHPLVPQEERRAYGRCDSICHAGARVDRPWLAGCRTGNPEAPAEYLRSKRGWRSWRKARVLLSSGTRIPRAETRSCPGVASALEY